MIIRADEIQESLFADSHTQGKKIVLVGGCFDILHAGHIVFLQKAKDQGDIVVVLLESDEQIKKIKGESRPVNTQQNRAFVLAALRSIDMVVVLPSEMHDLQYDRLISQIKPDIIATTAGDPNRRHKERQAGQIGAHVIDVSERLPEHSTSTVVMRLENI
jgi:rfaE bifunctional protein nucleotidyltransferase chain/domain